MMQHAALDRSIRDIDAHIADSLRDSWHVVLVALSDAARDADMHRAMLRAERERALRAAESSVDELRKLVEAAHAPDGRP